MTSGVNLGQVDEKKKLLTKLKVFIKDYLLMLSYKIILTSGVKLGQVDEVAGVGPGRGDHVPRVYRYRPHHVLLWGIFLIGLKLNVMFM